MKLLVPLLIALSALGAPARAGETPEQQLFRCVYRIYALQADGSSPAMEADYTNLAGKTSHFFIRPLGMLGFVIAPVTRGNQEGFIVHADGRLHFVAARLCKPGGPLGAVRRSEIEISHRYELTFGVDRRYVEISCSRDGHGGYRIADILADPAPRPGNPQASYLARGPNDAQSPETMLPVQNVIIAYADMLRKRCEDWARGCDGGAFCRHNLRANELQLQETCVFDSDNNYSEVLGRWQGAIDRCHALWEASAPGSPGPNPAGGASGH